MRNRSFAFRSSLSRSADIPVDLLLDGRVDAVLLAAETLEVPEVYGAREELLFAAAAAAAFC